MKLLINKAYCKEKALSLSKLTRNGKFTRVSNSFLLCLNAELERILKYKVHSHPSKGKTLKG